LLGSGGGGGRRGGGGSSGTLNGAKGSLNAAMNLMQDSEMPVTTQAANAAKQAGAAFNDLYAKYQKLTGAELKSINDQLAQAGLDKISL
jgi:hypothetical protein